MGIGDKAKSVAGAAARGTKTAAGAVARGTASVAVGYWRGLTYPFRGVKLVFFEHPGLVRFWIFPILLTGIFIAGVMWAGWSTHDEIANAIWEDPAAVHDEVAHKDWPTREQLAHKGKPTGRLKRDAPPEPDGWTTFGHWVHAAFEVLILLLMWALGVILAIALTNVVAAPFNDLLSEEVERIRTGREGPPFSWKVIARDTVRTVGLEAVKLGIYAVVMGPLFVLSLAVPGVGQVVYTIFGFLFTALYFAIDYIDWPASRRNRSITYRFGMLTQHFMPMFGFGTGVWLFLFVPLFNLLLMPAAVAGGTMLFLDLEGTEAEPPAAA